MKDFQKKLECIFHAAKELRSAEQREAYLRDACEGEPQLRAQVDELLKAASEADAVLPTRSLADQGTLPEGARTEGPGSKIGRYKLLQQIGEGGMGVVYMAEQEEPVRRRVALKIIKLGMDTRQVVARFEAERQALAMMDHPNIAHVLDGGITETGRPYFVMELVHGVPITEFCDKTKLPSKERLKLFIQVCQAIQSAHQKGIIHRDIKPSNILVTLHDGVPVPKVIDFGVAKATNQKLTEKTLFTNFGNMIGTPAYMSPEQAEMSGLDIDTRTDIYALGALLYALLTGTTPFPEKRLRSLGYGEMQRVILEEEPERPSTRLSTMTNEQKTLVARNCGAEFTSLSNLLKGDLDWIVMKCLEKDRTRRYETASGLVSDIQRHLSNEPVVARPPNRIYRFRKLIRRNKGKCFAAAAISAALIIGTVVSSWQAVQANQARREALAAQQREAVQREKAETNAKNAVAAQVKETKLREQVQTQELATRRRAYAADMSRVQHELNANNLRRAREFLGRYSPKAGETDLRGWEWRYLWQCCRSDALFKLVQQEPRVWYAAFSGDNKQIVTCDSEGAIKCWDVSRRTEVMRLQSSIKAKESAWAFKTPRLSDDGEWLAAATWNNRNWVVRVWDIARQKIVTELQFGEKSRINSLALSADKKLLATLDIDEGVSVWEISSSKKLAQFPVVTSVWNLCGAVLFSPDAKTLAIGDDDGRVRIVDLATFRETNSFVASSINGVISLAFSPDGRVLAAGCAFAEPQITVWDRHENKRLATLERHHGFVSSLAFSPDGQVMASASGDQMLKLWNTTTWKEEATLKGHLDEIWSVAFSRDGKNLISAGKDGSVIIWPTNVLASHKATLAVPLDLEWGDVSSEGKTVAGVLHDGRISMWNVATSQLRPTAAQFGTNNVAVFFPPGSEMLIAASNPAGIKVYNSDNDSLSEYPMQSKAQPDLFWFLPRDRTILAAHIDASPVAGTFQRWDAASRRELQPIPAGRAFTSVGDWSQVVFSSDEPLIAVEAPGRVAVQNLESGLEQYSFAFPHHGPIQGMTFIPGKRMLAAASLDGPIVKVWDLTARQQVAALHGHNLVHSSITASPDGQRLVTTTIGHEPLKIWDTASWEEVLSLDELGAGYYEGKFLPDGNTLIAWDRKGNVHFWRAPSFAEIEASDKAEANAN